MKYSSLGIALLVLPLLASAQLAVTVPPVKATGNRALVPLRMKNGYGERIESARASAFLLDGQGKMLGQSTDWVIGGTKNLRGLPAGGTNTFNFVITAQKPLTTTNLTARVQFNRIVLEGGKLADVTKDVVIKSKP